MNNKSLSNCPICHSDYSETIYKMNCGNVDNSELYTTVILLLCKSCGHIFNLLSKSDLAGLENYYNKEYAPANLNVVDSQGDRPGSNSEFTINRYEQLYEVLKPFLISDAKILDVGCAMGGFLDFLQQNGFKHLYGIDMTEKYVEQARVNNKFTIKQGNAIEIPFEDDTFDVIVMDQVLEHVHNPVLAFQEAKRVLKSGGIFCVGVPDASSYSTYPFFDYYWILLREHIQHFDDIHINSLALKNGFDVIENYRTTSFMNSEKMILPNMISVFRSNNESIREIPDPDSAFVLGETMKVYLEQEAKKLEIKRNRINLIIKSQQPVYIWGIGREFLYLYESSGLKKCNLAGLIDKNEHKRRTFLIEGLEVSDENILQNSTDNSLLIITAFAHIESIKAKVKELGFKGEVVEFADEEHFTK